MPDSTDEPTTRDAIVIIPGIMGSRLVETATGKTLWGLDRPSVFVDAWVTGHSLKDLELSEDELAGKLGRVIPGGLLTSDQLVPGLLGADKYSRLVAHAKTLVADDAAVLEFSYDWRLSVEYNAGMLAKAAGEHLRDWKTHSRASAEAKLVLIAHSMGGLVARYFTNVLGGAPDVRTTITLGTPYYGSMKTLYMMATGRGTPVPMPHLRVKRLIRRMPGMHDLLPFYRSVKDGDTARLVTPRDVDALGGDAELARQSIERHSRLISGAAGDLRVMVGVGQPTIQGISISGDVAAPVNKTIDVDSGKWSDLRGDNTVPRVAANAFDLQTTTLLGSHGSLPRTEAALAAISDIVGRRDRRPPLDAGGEGIGVSLPDVVAAGADFPVRVDGNGLEAASCVVTDLSSGIEVSTPDFRREDSELVFTAKVRDTGLFRVHVRAAGGLGSVSNTVMCVEPAAAELVYDEA